MPGILIVDDNANIRLLLRRFIETDTPFPVCGEAGNGLEAIERAAEFHPDAILLDLSMPIMNGTKAAAILKKTLPATKIILFTMHADEVPKAYAAKIGVDLVLSKEDGIGKLPEHLKTLLAPSNGAPSS